MDNSHDSYRSHRTFDPYEVLAATLRDLFDMPPEQVLRKVNAELAANPLTADVQLTLPPRFMAKP